MPGMPRYDLGRPGADQCIYDRKVGHPIAWVHDIHDAERIIRLLNEDEERKAAERAAT